MSEKTTLLKGLVAQIAKTAHEVNRAYCESIGDNSQPKWEDAPDWQKDSAVNAVLFHLSSSKTPEESHINWMEQKLFDGWKYGPVKDPAKKEHPCIMDYRKLPVEQRVKDSFFKAVVESFKGGL